MKLEETTIPRNEIIQVADIVAREKSIDREIVFVAMEEAIQKAGRSRYGNDRDNERSRNSSWRSQFAFWRST